MTGLTVLRVARTAPRTLIVLGSGRSGTSAVAGGLRILGVNMGLDPHPVKHEWSPIAYVDGKLDNEQTRLNIQQMQRPESVWGWKSPADFYSISQYIHLLEKPAFIVVTRDLIDIALSARRHEGLPLSVGLYESAMVYSTLFDRLRFLPFPSFVVSYSKVVQDPVPFALALSEALSLDVTCDMLAHFKMFARQDTKTYRALDPATNTEISEIDLYSDANATSRVVLSSRVPEIEAHSEELMLDLMKACEVMSGKPVSLPSADTWLELRQLEHDVLAVFIEPKILEATVRRPEKPISFKIVQSKSTNPFSNSAISLARRIEAKISGVLSSLADRQDTINHSGRYEFLKQLEECYLSLMVLRIIMQRAMEQT